MTPALHQQIHHHADDCHAQRVADVVTPANLVLEKIFECVNRSNEQRRRAADQNSQANVGQENNRVGRVIVGFAKLRDHE